MNENDIPKTQLEAINIFSDSGRCHDFMVDMRWNGKPVCAHCGSKNIGKLVVSNRTVKDKDGNQKVLTRRVWNCKDCKKQFTVKVGTIFEDSALGLEKWLPCVWLIVNAKNGISSCEIARTLGVTQRTGWFMAHRIRAAIHDGSFEKLCGGVEADETFIGAKARNMHREKRAEKVKGTGPLAMTPVMGLLERNVRKNASRVILKVLSTRRKAELQRHVRSHVAEGSTLLTDSLKSYEGLCHRSLENQPVGVESKPATPRWLIHIRFLDGSKGLSPSSSQFPLKTSARQRMILGFMIRLKVIPRF
jgi:transposase-like protein